MTMPAQFGTLNRSEVPTKSNSINRQMNAKSAITDADVRHVISVDGSDYVENTARNTLIRNNQVLDILDQSSDVYSTGGVRSQFLASRIMDSGDHVEPFILVLLATILLYTYSIGTDYKRVDYRFVSCIVSYKEFTIKTRCALSIVILAFHAKVY
jgi:hypothetical protein